MDGVGSALGRSFEFLDGYADWATFDSGKTVQNTGTKLGVYNQILIYLLCITYVY
jgi:hypothetical protein